MYGSQYAVFEMYRSHMAEQFGFLVFTQVALVQLPAWEQFDAFQSTFIRHHTFCISTAQFKPEINLVLEVNSTNLTSMHYLFCNWCLNITYSRFRFFKHVNPLQTFLLYNEPDVAFIRLFMSKKCGSFLIFLFSSCGVGKIFISWGFCCWNSFAFQ